MGKSKGKLGSSAARPVDDLLVTKFEIPFSGCRVVQRSRLTDLLEAGVDRRIALIVAPTGYGKTTLLAEWISSHASTDRRYAWLSLDEYDDHPRQFWKYVAGVVHKSCPQIRAVPGLLLRGGFTPRDITPLNQLLNQIAHYPHPIWLILDNFEVITHRDIQRNLAYFIDRLPGNLHLVFSSRILPAVPLARLRAQRQVLEINPVDLAFTYPEATAYLSGFSGLNLSHEMVSELLEDTEGWIAGLQIAAQSIGSQANLFGLPRDLTTGNRQIYTYLGEEVLDQQTIEIQEFLVKTSILAELSAPLCDAVLEREDSQRLLTEIKRANLFIQPLDSCGANFERYRFHPLFAETLRARLSLTYPEQTAGLHRRACYWLRANGCAEKAVTHALEAGDLEIASEIVDACALQAIINFDLTDLIDWINRFPTNLLIRHPRLSIYYALASFQLGKMDLIEPKFALIEETLATLPPGEIASADREMVLWGISVIRTVARAIQSDHPLASQAIQGLCADYPRQDIYFYGFLMHCLAEIIDVDGNLSAAAAAYQEGCRFALQHNLQVGYLHSQCGLARVHKQQGRLRDAERDYQQALDFAGQAGLGSGSDFLARTGLAEIALERGDLEGASRWIQEVIDHYALLISSTLVWPYRALISLRISAYYLAVGNIEDAKVNLEDTRKLVEMQKPTNPLLLDVLIDLNVRLWQAHDRLEINQAGPPVSLAGFDLHAINSRAMRMARARHSLATGHVVEALVNLKGICAEALENGAGERLLEGLVLLALAYRADGQWDLASASLEDALRRAAQENYLRVFLDEGKPVHSLLADYLAKTRPNRTGRRTETVERRYARQLVAAIDQHQANRAAHISSDLSLPTTTIAPNHEPLSPREIEVVERLVMGESAKEIAQGLCISINTVKVHIKSIYRKLGSHSRKVVFNRLRAADRSERVEERAPIP